MRLETKFSLSSDGAQPAPEPSCNPGDPPLLFRQTPAGILAGTMQQLIDDLSEEIALLDEDCNILAVNRRWKMIAEEHGTWDSMPGYNYRTTCMKRAAEGYQPAVSALAAIDEIIAGTRDYWQLVYNGGERWSGRDFQICYHRIQAGDQSLISVTRYDLTDVLELRRVKEKLSHSLADGKSSALAGTMQQLIDDLPEQIALLDRTGTILSANRAWKEIVRQYDYLDAMPGHNYRSFCADKAAQGYQPAVEAVAALDDICSGKRSFWQLDYNGQERWSGHDFRICFHRIVEGNRTFVLVTRHDLTEISELRRAKDELSRSSMEGRPAALDGTMQQVIDELPDQIAVLDENGVILAANRAWTEIVGKHGYEDLKPGHNFRDFCATKAREGFRPASEKLAALDELSSGKRQFAQVTYNGKEGWSGRDCQVSFRSILDGEHSRIMVTRHDLTEISELRRARDDFAHSLMEGQALERQRMARELHDSASQLLTGVGLLLCRLKREAPAGETVALVDELQGLVKEAQQEIRVVSYLALPPALEKQSLFDALKAVVDGFGSRTSLQTSFEIVGDPAPIPMADATALYRCAQEALSNVHRHAHSNRVRLLLCFRQSATHLVVADDGIGITPDIIAGRGGGVGVGLPSMRSRLSEIGGRLTVHRLPQGTAIVATVSNSTSD